MKPIADIHTHSTLKAFNSGYPNPSKNIWEKINHRLDFSSPSGKFAIKNSDDVSKHSQSNFYDLIEGQVRVPTVSLYPMETGFIDLRNIADVITSEKGKEDMIEIVTGYHSSSIKFLRKYNDYFRYLNDEYLYLFKQQGKSPCGKYEFILPKNYTHLIEILKKDNTIAPILSIEGAHVFYDKMMLTEKLTQSEMKRKLVENIQAVKDWEVPPFTMNLSHHFYNGLCGHSRSMKGIVRHALLNQNKGLEKGFTGLGIIASREMVSRQNGKRIIIDTKHMSLQGRIDYYGWIRGYNRISVTDKIPIVCSHTGVNGYKTMKASLLQPDNMKKLAKSHFNRWSINISDEEIKIIHESTGLIGIMMDKYKMAGTPFFEKVAKISDVEKVKDAYAEVFMDNVLQIVQAINKPSGWDCIAIGTDYDGSIPHVDPYDTSSKLQDFRSHLLQFLQKTNYGQELWFGLKPEKIIDKIFYENAMGFYANHFV